jgi:hypothetical protein
MAFMDWSELEQGLRKVVTQAMTDPIFREVCLQDPASAYAQASGFTVPEGFSLRFREGGATELVVSLPEFPKEDGPLSDQELQEVAGGFDTCTDTLAWHPSQKC